MKTVVALMALAAMAGAQRSQTFAGRISDDMCPKADHSAMQMGPTDPECVSACISAHGAAYVLYDGKAVYKLSSRQPLEQFAGQAVQVAGVLDAKTNTIRVNSITRERLQRR